MSTDAGVLAATATTTLPFAPLTHGELNERADAARTMCGFVAAAVVRRQGGVFDRYDLNRLRELGAEAAAYHDAAMARVTA